MALKEAPRPKGESPYNTIEQEMRIYFSVQPVIPWSRKGTRGHV